MQMYLPIAGVSENVFIILAVGGGVGFLSGMFGVGGGFLLTPLLLQIGIPAPVAVASGANQVVGASVSGFMAHLRRRNIDFKMGLILLLGGFAGSSAGVIVFRLLRSMGQVDLVISLSYVLLLGAIGGLMLIESVRAIMKTRRYPDTKAPRGQRRHTWMHGLPFKMRFPRSRLYISALLPLIVGFMVGMLSAIMGVGGGFVMVPAMIYLIGMPTSVVVGTSLFQIMFVTANITFLQAVGNQTVDVLLVVMLLVGGVIGAQLGTRVGAKLRAEQLRLLLALMVLGMGVKVFHDLTVHPDDLYSLTVTAIATE
jgi:uncharacterized membrane protein YfcA